MTPTARTIVAGVWLAVLLTAAATANGFQTGSRWFPLYTALIAAAFAAVSLVQEASASLRLKRSPSMSNSAATVEYRRARRFLLWIVLYCVAAVVVGLIPATIVWIAAFWRIHTDLSWSSIGLRIAPLIGALWVLRSTIGLDWPTGIFL